MHPVTHVTFFNLQLTFYLKSLDDLYFLRLWSGNSILYSDDVYPTTIDAYPTPDDAYPTHIDAYPTPDDAYPTHIDAYPTSDVAHRHLTTRIRHLTTHTDT